MATALMVGRWQLARARPAGRRHQVGWTGRWAAAAILGATAQLSLPADIFADGGTGHAAGMNRRSPGYGA